MVNTTFLSSSIQASGKNKEELAGKCGITLKEFLQKCEGKKDFVASEIQVLCEELNITDIQERMKIFFDH